MLIGNKLLKSNRSFASYMGKDLFIERVNILEVIVKLQAMTL